MKEFYVTASLCYGYTIQVPDDFDFNDQFALMEFASDADPILFNAKEIDNPETSLTCIQDLQGNTLYNWF